MAMSKLQQLEQHHQQGVAELAQKAERARIEEHSMAIEREAKLQESYLQYANEQAALNARREVMRLERTNTRAATGEMLSTGMEEMGQSMERMAQDCAQRIVGLEQQQANQPQLTHTCPSVASKNAMDLWSRGPVLQVPGASQTRVLPALL
jgi:hypothetical protein